MKTVNALGISLLTLVVGAWPAVSTAQDTKTARGTLTAMDSRSLTVKVGANDMKFAVDAQTVVVASGAGTKARKAEAAGQAGPKLADVLKTGQALILNYRETGGTMYATRVQAVSSAGPNGGSVAKAAAPAAKRSTGEVKSIAANRLTITSDGRDMTFAFDPSTSVVARGAGTKSAASGGRLAMTDAVKAGDRVTVSYRDLGGTMHATTVRVFAAK